MCMCACEKDSAACLCGKRSTKQRGGKTQVKDKLLWVHLKASWQALINIKSKIDIDPRKKYWCWLTHLNVKVWQQWPEKQWECTLIGCTNTLPICRPKNKQVMKLKWKLRQKKFIRIHNYLSGRVYDITESSGGKGSNPITGWVVTSWWWNKSPQKYMNIEQKS